MNPSTHTTISRSPNIAWQHGFERYWCQGSPAITHAFNAFSFLLPKGELFFIQVALDSAKKVDLENVPTLKRKLSLFVLQETKHIYQHRKYNAHLHQQGFTNVIEAYIVSYQDYSRQHFSKLTNLALVCAYEHYTAIIGNYILDHPALLPSSSPDLALVWGWHCVEELEHKTACFDLYQSLKGSWLRRVLVFILASLNLGFMFGTAYINLLFSDGCLKLNNMAKTISDCTMFFFGRAGIFWHLIRQGALYFDPGFYPSELDDHVKINQWLMNNQGRLRLYAQTHLPQPGSTHSPDKDKG